MRQESGSRWQRRGSSIIFDAEALSPLLSADCLVSLRTFMGWLGEWPGMRPGNGQTVLVGGLEPCLELFNPEEAERFLRFKVRPVVEEFQYQWSTCGLVFGFGKPPGAFRLDAITDEMSYIRQDRRAVRLAYSLWNGGTSMDIAQLVRNKDKGKEIIGYYVPRLS